MRTKGFVTRRHNNCEVTETFSFIYRTWPPLWSSGQSSWRQIQRSGFNSRHLQDFWEVVGLERGPLSFMSTIEELLERKSSGSGLENEITSEGDPPRLPRDTPLYWQKLSLSSPTSGGCSVGSLVDSGHGVSYTGHALYWIICALIPTNFFSESKMHILGTVWKTRSFCYIRKRDH
jgi:hypothetical protein